MKKLLTLLAAALLAAPAVRAQDNSPQAEPPKEDEAPKAAKTGGKEKAGGEDRAYVDAAVSFLKGLAHSSRKGEQGEKAWEALKETAGDKVTVKIGDKEHTVDIAGKKSDLRLLKFQKISTLREGKDIKGVTVEVLDFKVGKEMHSGKGKVLMAEKDGKWTVTSVEAE
jgi:hypothetical protein